MRKFEDLDVEEQRNEILKGIHNQLSQINKWLEVIAARYAKLSADDVDGLRFDAERIHYDIDAISYGDFSSVGYTKARGLYKTFLNGGKETSEPLGEYQRTAPIDKETCFFIEEEKSKRKQQ